MLTKVHFDIRGLLAHALLLGGLQKQASACGLLACAPPGGLPEYEAVREVAAALAPEEWTTTEQRLLNRALSPILVLFLRRPAKHMDL